MHDVSDGGMYPTNRADLILSVKFTACECDREHVCANREGSTQQNMTRHGTVEVPQSLEPRESQSQEEMAGRVYASANRGGLTQQSTTRHGTEMSPCDIRLPKSSQSRQEMANSCPRERDNLVLTAGGTLAEPGTAGTSESMIPAICEIQEAQSYDQFCQKVLMDQAIADGTSPSPFLLKDELLWFEWDKNPNSPYLLVIPEKSTTACADTLGRSQNSVRCYEVGVLVGRNACYRGIPLVRNWKKA